MSITVYDGQGDLVDSYDSDAMAVRAWCDEGSPADRYETDDGEVGHMETLAQLLNLDGWQWAVEQRDRRRFKAARRCLL